LTGAGKSVTITKYSNDSIEDNYTGEDYAGNQVCGSFVFKNVGDDN
jgi:hypothetical protein